ncbi:MAG: sensor histidine kinase [Anaerolineales bacterium]|nr:sensor histidine kinase [Anaerolineales bacterium]
MTMRDAFEKADRSKQTEVEIARNEIAIFKNLILERAHPLDLVRELLSNAGAREVAASRIEISYTKDREGHVFEVDDDGCGMTYTGSAAVPGRLDRFLGLGLSAIAGFQSDEFSWKGLGSKLAYQSHRVEIRTRAESRPEYSVTVNEPWETLQRGDMPRPRVAEFEGDTEGTFTRIRVVGHPPHRQDKPFDLPEIRDFLLHRTFAGFTRSRSDAPRIVLSVLGNQEELTFGFPPFVGMDWPDGLEYDEENRRLLVHIVRPMPNVGHVVLKGFLAWDGDRYGLDKNGLNTGLILSSKGIPYFELDLAEYGAQVIHRGYPGKGGTCLVVECDAMGSQMNISRNGLVDSGATVAFRAAVSKLLDELEKSGPYLDQFRRYPERKKRIGSADNLSEQKRVIEADDSMWVVYQRADEPIRILMREPKNENEVNALIWKLEALGAFPFAEFQTLGYVGAAKGPDMLANFQETSASEPQRATVIEVENNFYSYKDHGHYPGQYPKVICWDVPAGGRRVRFREPNTGFKLIVDTDEYQIHVFVLKRLPGIQVMSRAALRAKGVRF